MSDFGDCDPLDALSGDDDQVEWGQVYDLADKFAAVLAIENDEERLEAAKALVAQLNA